MIMSGTDWLPHGDNELRSFAENYDQIINADPASVGLTALEASSYSATLSSYVTALGLAQSPMTNSQGNISAKNTQKSDLVTATRSTARVIRNHPGITDQQLTNLGLTVPDPTPSPVPVPTSAPDILIDKTAGNLVTVRLRDAENPDSRGKPEGVSGASIYQFVGAQPPSLGDIEAWTFHGNTTRTLNTLDFSDEQPGATIWLTSVWFNTRMDSGPATDPVVVQLPGTYQQAA